MPTISTLLTQAEKDLKDAGINSPRTDAEWILASILNCTRFDLHLKVQKPLLQPQINLFRDVIHHRAQRIPLQHLLEQTEFYGLPFHTSPDALIPRPETETLIETILNHAPKRPHILDIGTGSGIIAITLAHQLPKARVIATDISLSALQLAKKNAHLNGVSNRITFIKTNLLAPFNVPFDIIVSNPPYIPTQDIKTLDPEVHLHDPIIALDGGPDGLTFYRHIINQSAPLLGPGGILAFEIGHDQANTVSDLLSYQHVFEHIAVHRDLSGHPRVVCAQKQS